MTEGMPNQFFLVVLRRVTIALCIASLIDLVGRLTDYASGDIFSVGIVEVTDNISPYMWAAMCAGSGGVVVAGLVRMNWRVVAIGALLCSCVYVCFSAIALIQTFERQPYDDWRFWLMYLTMAAHWGIVGVSAALLSAVQLDHEVDDCERR